MVCKPYRKIWADTKLCAANAGSVLSNDSSFIRTAAAIVGYWPNTACYINMVSRITPAEIDKEPL